jgi:hypothetical protein
MLGKSRGYTAMKTTYQMLVEAKVAAMKRIFVAVGGGFEKLALIMSNDELSKSFDYLSKKCVSNDDEESDIALWLGFLEFAKENFSRRVYEFVED